MLRRVRVRAYLAPETTERERQPGRPVPAASPRAHRDVQFLERKRSRLWEPHVKPVNELVDEIRAERGAFVPCVDPDSGGVDARVLFVIESPAAPAAHGSGMLSPDNDDVTAANLWHAYDVSGLPRSAGLHWNAVVHR